MWILLYFVTSRGGSRSRFEVSKSPNGLRMGPECHFGVSEWVSRVTLDPPNGQKMMVLGSKSLGGTPGDGPFCVGGVSEGFGGPI